MICKNCGEKLEPNEMHTRPGPFVNQDFICSPKAERSGVLQGCPPSATGSQAHCDNHSFYGCDPESTAELRDIYNRDCILDASKKRDQAFNKCLRHFPTGFTSGAVASLLDGLLAPEFTASSKRAASSSCGHSFGRNGRLQKNGRIGP